jgi:hypothetical protein
MIDPASISMLAASAVALLSPFLKKAADKGAEKLGESAAGTLFEKLKLSLKTPAGQEALSDLAKQPDDTDNQAGLRKEIRKAAEQDPEFAQLLHGLLSEAGASTASDNQIAIGDNNKQAKVSDSSGVTITQS